MTKTQMTITVPTGKAGEVAYFSIEFNKSDFMEVIDSLDSVTTENINSQKLFTIV